jgi:hypothetical protein
MPATYEKIATTTLGSAAATIDFTSIAASWTDLRVVLVCTGSTFIYPSARVNSSSTLYSYTVLIGDGSSATSYRAPGSEISLSWNGTNTTPVFYTLDIFSYAGSTFKTILTTGEENQNGTPEAVNYAVHLWRNTDAITAVNLRGTNGNFAVGTTATIYGIKKA